MSQKFQHGRFRVARVPPTDFIEENLNTIINPGSMNYEYRRATNLSNSESCRAVFFRIERVTFIFNDSVMQRYRVKDKQAFAAKELEDLKDKLIVA